MKIEGPLQRLADRVAIQDVLSRYFYGADIGDKSVVRSCFTQDVRAQYDGRPPVSGIDALLAQIPLFERQATGVVKICTHFMGNLQVKQLEVDRAETETYAFAFLVLPKERVDIVSMRSLRYLDRLVRDDGEWKISARIHTLDWSCDVPVTFALAMSQRQREIPVGLFDS